MSQLELRTVYDLLDKKFFIPSYQRGYRWKEPQVRALLDHIWEFSAKSHDIPLFYCLQPVVVKKKNDKWEVIDGQQRLTTISLILQYLVKHCAYNLYGKTIFSLEYETRERSAEFLNDIDQKQPADAKNIDFYHMKKGYDTVNTWVNEHFSHDNDKTRFIGSFLGRKYDEEKSILDLKSTQVIWYEVEDIPTTDSYSLFSRLNIGKIGLTNAELIKALFLSHDESVKLVDNELKYFQLRQVQIASEWDAIEKNLQNNLLWHFIQKSSFSYITRIEYIFDVITGNLTVNVDREERRTFNMFYNWIHNSKNHKDIPNEFINLDQLSEYQTKAERIDFVWKNIKKIFQAFETWFEDNELFHLIGFITVMQMKTIDVLLREYKKTDKKKFKQWLKKMIFEEFEEIEWDDLEKDHPKVHFVLLLFNLVISINSNNYRLKFPFDKYVEGQWDIEHIHALVEKDKFRQDDINRWIDMFQEYFENLSEYSEITQKISDLMGKGPISPEEFGTLYNDVKGKLSLKDLERVNWIGNLALLDSGTNRSYKNIWFPFKRQRILKEDSDGKHFIPLATKNIFMKVYSGSLPNPTQWSDDDAQKYADRMKTEIRSYLQGNPHA